MAEQATGQGFRSGPGNKRIATTFLESLAVRGQAAPRTRAMRALGLGEAGLAEAAAWTEDFVPRHIPDALDLLAARDLVVSPGLS